MTELLPLNNSPINQQAKKILRALKAEVSQGHLYSLQLAIEGLKLAKTEGWMAEYQPLALEQAESMLAWTPAKVQSLMPESMAVESDDQTKAGEEAAVARAVNLGIGLWENLQPKMPHLSPPTQATE